MARDRYPDKQAKNQRKKARKKLKSQMRRQYKRDTYGPRGKPAPVTVRSLETGEALGVHRQAVLTGQFKNEDAKEKADWVSERFAHLGFKSYGGYLRSKHWSEVKTRWKLAGGSTRCFVCGKDECQLHHVTYLRLGCEEFDDLVPLCKRHHRAVHWEVSHRGWPLSTAHIKLAEREERRERWIEQRFEEAA